jgi:Domain of unknown function (DUF4389)
MAKKRKKLSPEKKEAWMRIPLFIISGFILNIWGFFIFCFALVQLILILVKNKKEKELLRMCNIYLVQLYVFVKYVTFLSNERPFPFGDFKKEIRKK